MNRYSHRTGRVRRNIALWNTPSRRKSRTRRIRFNRAFPFKIILGLFCLYLGFEILTFPFLSLARLPTENPTETALMRQRINEAHDQKKVLHIDYRWTPISSVPRHVRLAVLVAEDGAFFSHAGVDWHEVWESVETNWEKGRIVRGGSTITQQLAKNLYLSTSRDPIRKFKELILAWILETTLSKKRILELYLNVIEWGPGVFGIEAAAQRYFHKPTSRLSMEEGVRLAAVIPSPLRHRPTENTTFLQKKKQLIFHRMSTR